MDKKRIRRYYTLSTIFFLGWSLLIFYSGVKEIKAEREKTLSMARNEAVTTFNKDQALRYWSSAHGGVYVPISEKTPPNPYLSHIPHRDVRTDAGQSLTLMNPAYMLRQVMKDYEGVYGTKGHITSLKPLNPINAPDAWERKTLEKFETGGIQEVFEMVGQGQDAHIRLMRPMITEKSCLKCHEIQGYKVGQIRGGVGVKVAVKPYLQLEKSAVFRIVLDLMLFWCAGSFVLIAFFIHLKKTVQNEVLFTVQLERSNSDLTKALNEIKTLKGIIPICSYCKKIRDDQGFWNQLEAYLLQHSQAEFSHGLCPECFKKQMDEIE